MMFDFVQVKTRYCIASRKAILTNKSYSNTNSRYEYQFLNFNESFPDLYFLNGEVLF